MCACVLFREWQRSFHSRKTNKYFIIFDINQFLFENLFVWWVLRISENWFSFKFSCGMSRWLNGNRRHFNYFKPGRQFVQLCHHHWTAIGLRFSNFAFEAFWQKEMAVTNMYYQEVKEKKKITISIFLFFREIYVTYIKGLLFSRSFGTVSARFYACRLSLFARTLSLAITAGACI